MHARRSVRLPLFDYRTPGAYFVTVCTRDRVPLFGEVVAGQMCRSALGEIVWDEWHLLPERRPDVEIDAFVVMPDHVHGIVWIIDDRRGAINCARTERRLLVEPGSLSSIVRAFKAGVTRRARQERGIETIWQRGFYEHVIRTPGRLDQIRRYIIENPLRWHLRYR